MSKINANLLKEVVKRKFISLPKYHIISDDYSEQIDITVNNLINRYEKLSSIDTLAFPGRAINFDDIYEPLTLNSEEYTRSLDTAKIDDHTDIHSFISRYTRVIIEDSAGMGKSTIAKKFFRICLEKYITIPILIELRHINRTNTIANEIWQQLTQNNSKYNRFEFDDLLRLESFFIIFDGYDEISTDDRNDTIKDLQHFIYFHKLNYYIITSRDEHSLTSFQYFKKFKIKPLERQEAFSLINRYDKYSFKPIANRLIEKIKDDNDSSVIEYLQNPLLVSLLYKAYDYKKDIPLKKSLFYRQIFEALFEAHDETKQGYYKRKKYSNLHIDDFERVLRYVAYFTAIQNKVEYEVDYLLSKIEKAKVYTSDLNFKSSDFIKDLLETVPLFKKEGNYIKWSHKSLQDYFTAKFVWLDTKLEQEPILYKAYHHSNSEQFNNMLELFYELDPLAYESTILYWQLKDFKEYANQHISLLTNIPINLKKNRIENMFQNEKEILIMSENDYDDFIRKMSLTGLIKRQDKSNFIKINDITLRHVVIHEKKILIACITKTTKTYASVISLTKKIYPNLLKLIKGYSDDNPLEYLKRDRLYLLNYDENNPLNETKIFDSTNALISEPGTFTYNYDEVLKKIEVIEIIKKKNSTNDLLNWQ